MTVSRVRNIIAGIFLLLSLGLGVAGSPLFHNANWLWLAAFVGANLLQSGFTNWCMLDKILARLGLPVTGGACGT
jgi:hypothetical protein